LLEVVVRGERVLQATLAHQQEADRIRQRVALVKSLLEQLNGAAVDCLTDPHNLHVRVARIASRNARAVARGSRLACARATNSARTKLWMIFGPAASFSASASSCPISSALWQQSRPDVSRSIIG